MCIFLKFKSDYILGLRIYPFNCADADKVSKDSLVVSSKWFGSPMCIKIGLSIGLS